MEPGGQDFEQENTPGYSQEDRLEREAEESQRAGRRRRAVVGPGRRSHGAEGKRDSESGDT